VGTAQHGPARTSPSPTRTRGEYAALVKAFIGEKAYAQRYPTGFQVLPQRRATCASAWKTPTFCGPSAHPCDARSGWCVRRRPYAPPVQRQNSPRSFIAYCLEASSFAYFLQLAGPRSLLQGWCKPPRLLSSHSLGNRLIALAWNGR